MRGLLMVLALFGLTGGLYSESLKTVLSEEAKFKTILTNENFMFNSPFVLKDGIVFTYIGEAKTVLLAGDFNGWKAKLLFEKKTNNIWIYTWENRMDMGQHQYKLMVDGIWIEDPLNTNFIIDQSGQKVSAFTLEEDFIPFKKYPLLLKNNEYVFRYFNPGAQQVMLVGDFNHWNPYSIPLKYTGAGWFEIRMTLSPGYHIYCYVVDGEWIPDPGNLVQYSDTTGSIVNVLKVPGELKPY